MSITLSLVHLDASLRIAPARRISKDSEQSRSLNDRRGSEGRFLADTFEEQIGLVEDTPLITYDRFGQLVQAGLPSTKYASSGYRPLTFNLGFSREL